MKKCPSPKKKQMPDFWYIPIQTSLYERIEGIFCNTNKLPVRKKTKKNTCCIIHISMIIYGLIHIKNKGRKVLLYYTSY